MTKKRYFIYEDNKTGDYHIAPNRLILLVTLKHLQNRSKPYVDKNLNEIGFLMPNLRPMFYDCRSLRDLIMGGAEEFMATAKELREDVKKASR